MASLVFLKYHFPTQSRTLSRVFCDCRKENHLLERSSIRKFLISRILSVIRNIIATSKTLSKIYLLCRIWGLEKRSTGSSNWKLKGIKDINKVEIFNLRNVNFLAKDWQLLIYINYFPFRSCLIKGLRKISN